MPPRRLALLGLALALLLATAMVAVLRDDGSDPDPAPVGAPSTETIAPGAPGATCELEDAVGNVPTGLWSGPLTGPDGADLGSIGLVVEDGRVTSGRWSRSDDDDEGAVTGPATAPVLSGFGSDASLTIVAFGCESVTATLEMPGQLAGTTMTATWNATPGLAATPG